MNYVAAVSLLSAKSSFLSIKPRVEDTSRFVSVRTNGFLRFLSLWSYDYLVEIDVDRRRIDVSRRLLWAFTRTRTIEFDAVDQVDYRYSSRGTSWSYFRRNDSVETYRISLILAGSGERVPVASFRGEGAVMTGVGGVLRGDSLVDWQGDQQDASRALFDRLKDLIESPDRKLPGRAVGRAPIRSCVECGQAAPPNYANCLYCGGRVEQRKIVTGVAVD